MKSFTPKQRAAIFLKAAKRMHEMGYGESAGAALLDAMDMDYESFYLTDYPEYLLFSPMNGENNWWNFDESGKQQRVIALLLCHWMAKDAER